MKIIKNKDVEKAYIHNKNRNIKPIKWKIYKLKEICDLINGMAFKPQDWSNDGLKIVRIQNLNGGNQYNYYNKLDYNDKYVINNNELLFSWSGSIGTSFGSYLWKGEKSLLNQHIFKIKLKNDFNNKFFKSWFYYYLKDVEKRAENDAHGSGGLVHIRKATMENYNILIPSNEEVEKIASVLSKQERQVEIIETLIEKLEKRNQHYAEKLLSGEKRIRKNDQGEIEFYDNTEWQDVSLNGKIVSIPKGWMKMKISDFFEINMGKTILSKNISKNFNNNNNIPVFSATEMFKVFGYVDIKTINKNRLLKENDLVIGARGTIGSVHKMNGLSTSTQTTIQCRRKTEDNNICFHYIKCNRKNIFKHEGGAIPQLTVASMNMLEIIYKKEDAYNINNFLSLLDKELNILKKILIKEKLRFQWMLDNLLSGEYQIVD